MKKIFALLMVSLLFILASCWETQTSKTDVNVETPVQEMLVEDKITEDTVTETMEETMSWDLSSESMEISENEVETNTWTEITTTSTYTLEEVANHNNQDDCRTIVNGEVYDISSFFGKHPGWDAALKQLCWVDGTIAFENQHGWEDKPEMVLNTFYKWDLK